MKPETLRKIRENANLSQEELAKKLNMSKQYMSYLETGKKKIGQKFLDKLFSLTEFQDINLEDYEKEASPERPDWLKNLSEIEELQLQEMIEKDKELLSLFFGACSGDKQKIKLFCQYLSSKYGADL